MKTEAIGIVDIGASGGRFSTLSRTRAGFALDAVRNFPHPLHELRQKRRDGAIGRRLLWNPMVVYEGILASIGTMAAADDRELVSLGVDSWGSDGVWLDSAGDLLTPAYASRCTHFDAARAELDREIPPLERFRLTGTYHDTHIVLNNLYWNVRNRPWLVENAAAFLSLPSLYAYWLCGEQATEYTWATTGQIASTVTGDYATELFERLRLPLDKMPRLARGGGELGRVHNAVADSLGVRPFRILLQPAHDTACAFAAAEVRPGTPTLVISAGSWWCMGMALPWPVTTDEAFAAKLTNVGGAEGVILNRVVPGGLLSHFLKTSWEREDGRAMPWEEYNRLARLGRARAPALDIDDPRFGVPAGIPQAIAAAAGRDGAPETSRARLAAAVYNGLADSVAEVAGIFSRLAGTPMREILVIGGGAGNDVLNQWLADRTGLAVRTGPGNATTLGGALVQARDLGWFSSLAEGRGALSGLWRQQVFQPGGHVAS